nr:putative ribonuclease H-like domain-containing protein [Tanacetum cinerariifolium]
MTNEPYDDVRGRYPKDAGTRFSFEDNTDLSLANAEGFVDVHTKPKSVPVSIDSIVANENSGQLDATSDNEMYESKGEEFGNFDLLFGSNEGDLESMVDGSLRRSVEAMNKEMEALNRNNTWVITDLPKGRKPVGCKWIYKIKYKSNGEVERYQVRLVAKGCSQKEGLYYEETFSPIVKMVSVRCVLSLVMQNQWSIFQLDVNNAFMYRELDEDVYMSLPDGYYVLGDNRLSHAMHGPLKSDLGPKRNGWHSAHFTTFRENREAKNSTAIHEGASGKSSAPGKGVLYNKSSNFELCVFVDSNWAKCNATWRFVFGFAVFLSSCLVSWKNLKVDYTIPVEMFCDSSAAMRIAANPVFHERKKHFMIDLYFLREKIAEDVLKTCLELYVKLRIAQGVKVSSG